MLNLLFPKVCSGCNDALLSEETIICTNCRHQLPMALFHQNNDESMKNIFFGRFPITEATALIKFQKKGISQELLHNLKYRGDEEISYFFGKWLGAELAEIPHYQNVDLVIPVPLHKQKLKKRGYNQVTGFAVEIAKALNTLYRDDILIKTSKTNSQVFKNRILRFDVEEEFTIQKTEEINNKHILLVDDIVTTGATLEKCALQLLKAENITISIATIAIA